MKISHVKYEVVKISRVVDGVAKILQVEMESRKFRKWKRSCENFAFRFGWYEYFTFGFGWCENFAFGFGWCEIFAFDFGYCEIHFQLGAVVFKWP